MKFSRIPVYTFPKALDLNKIREHEKQASERISQNSQKYKSEQIKIQKGLYDEKRLIPTTDKFSHIKTYKIMKSLDCAKPSLKLPGPGPGTYNFYGKDYENNALPSKKNYHVPTTLFGQEKKCPNLLNSCAPGPIYPIYKENIIEKNISNQTDDGYKFSHIQTMKFGNEIKGKEFIKPCSPGPIYYSDYKNKEDIKISFGTEKKFSTFTNNFPGPKYDIRNDLGKDAIKYSFSKDKRMDIKSKEKKSMYKLRKYFNNSENEESKKDYLIYQNRQRNLIYHNINFRYTNNEVPEGLSHKYGTPHWI